MSAEPSSAPKDVFAAYDLIEVIGQGAFGKVYSAKNKTTGELVAVKEIELDQSDEDFEDIQLEIQILSGCRSEYITRYQGSYVSGSRLWLVMELLEGGSCRDLLKAGTFSETQIAVIIRELLLALDYVHTTNRMVHRDIKAANTLISATGGVKLADFGVAAQMSHRATKNAFVGTPFWIAPEIIKGLPYDTKADIWSVGITVIELATGNPPYVELDPMKVLYLIPKNQPPQLEGQFSKHIKDFVKVCLQKDPRKRPSARDLLKHKFLKKQPKTKESVLELITRYRDWKVKDKQKEDERNLKSDPVDKPT
eukprot:CAMPEP_0174238248 /NCGR_PEP_ID=MMETSP0417-20130205/10669_1 /TAXON_ID=242541 /ORGANISM="Mayorella sp, Strain BSH-02190019" /LENGTH=308 /DNA_ID=CAMNT_0015317065 /DNA_START=75 /DNA_END=998 /DNA_ORIENTATION=-